MPKIHVKYECSKEISDLIYDALEITRATGKLKRGTNEVTKNIERNLAKFVVIAEDVEPPEILMHIPMLCDEKKIPYGYVPSKIQLGKCAGLDVSTISVSVIEYGESENMFKQIISKINSIRRGS